MGLEERSGDGFINGTIEEVFFLNRSLYVLVGYINDEIGMILKNIRLCDRNLITIWLQF